MCGAANVYWLMASTIVSLISVIGVSTLQYPTSTVLVITSSLNLLSNATFTCAAISENMKIVKMSIALATIMVFKTSMVLISTMIMKYEFMRELMEHFGLMTDSVAPEIMRMILFVAGGILFLHSLILECQVLCLYRRIKNLGPIIPWSYGEQGLGSTNGMYVVNGFGNTQGMYVLHV